MIKYKGQGGYTRTSPFYAQKSLPLEMRDQAQSGMTAIVFARKHIKEITSWLEPFNRALKKWEEKLDADELQLRRAPDLALPVEPVLFLRQYNGRLVPIITDASLPEEEGNLPALRETQGEDWQPIETAPEMVFIHMKNEKGETAGMKNEGFYFCLVGDEYSGDNVIVLPPATHWKPI